MVIVRGEVYVYVNARETPNKPPSQTITTQTITIRPHVHPLSGYRENEFIHRRRYRSLLGVLRNSYKLDERTTPPVHAEMDASAHTYVFKTFRKRSLVLLSPCCAALLCSSIRQSMSGFALNE